MAAYESFSSMLETLDQERLRCIGWSPLLLQNLMSLTDLLNVPGTTLFRVTEVHRESVTVHDGHAEQPARLLPALRHELAAQMDALAVGDWVLARPEAPGDWWLHARVPPLNQLSRRLHDGRDKVTRTVIVSNVDTAVLVMGLDMDFSLRRLERYLALAHLAQVAPLVVLSKSDLTTEAQARVAAVQAAAPAHTPVLAVNALDASSVEQLRPWTQRGQTLVLLGSSGAGKSSLTNTLMGQSVASTGGQRKGDGRGRHTTTTRTLHALSSGGCVIDTPGLRTLRLDGDAEALASAFVDITTLAMQCRFRNCSHADEPGCAVRESVDTLRLRSWHKLQREARRDTQTALQRKEQVQQWKQRGRAARARVDAKKGVP